MTQTIDWNEVYQLQRSCEEHGKIALKLNWEAVRKETGRTLPLTGTEDLLLFWEDIRSAAAWKSAGWYTPNTADKACSQTCCAERWTKQCCKSALRQVIERERQAGYDVWLEVALKNPQARSLYETAGFQIREVQSYYEYLR